MHRFPIARNVLSIRTPVSSTSSSPSIVHALTTKDSNAILIDYPAGAYTAMRTFDQTGIMDFSGHVARLAGSLQQLHFPDPVTQQEPSTTAKSLSSEVAGAQSTIESVQVQQGLAPFRTVESLLQETRELVRSGLQFYYQEADTDNLHGHGHGDRSTFLRVNEAPPAEGYSRTSTPTAIADRRETRVTILCTWNHATASPVFVALFEPLPAKSGRCKIEIHGSPRHCATAKDSQWVRDRAKIMEIMEKDSNESILLNSNTMDLYEGLSSNFFAVLKTGQVVTAPPESVLQGTILKVVVAVCKANNIPLLYKFPNLNEISEWEGAFITSTSRLVLPVEIIVLPEKKSHVFGESATVSRIKELARQECIKRVEVLL